MAKIEIYGKPFNLKSSSDEIRVEEAAAYVDAKMHELAQSGKKTPYMDLSVLAALNIAMELLELQKETSFDDQVREEKIGRLIDVLEAEVQNLDN
tara:strand:- start:115 stop:399 length:285 start_codon:yes stop_codon:yes gene_type:complete